MNDRFGINLKNNESNFNPMNDPAKNVYGVERYYYSDILVKNKRKYPNLHGNNFNSPDNFQLSYLHDNEVYKFHAPKYMERRKIFPDLKFTSQSLDKGKKIFNIKNETKDTLNDFSYKKVQPFMKKFNNGYNIINHRVNPVGLDGMVQSKYLSKMAEFNLSIQKKEKNWILSKLNNNHRLNDGIYDYLKEHNYV
jgi:hypothetical protein